jgi:predicted cupin superfamily sugar epimerase
MTADEIIGLLDLAPHPEGGHFREMFRDAAGPTGRAHATAIYFLLKAGERSHWHRVDATEIWHWYAGDALDLHIFAAGQAAQTLRLGNDLVAGERPQGVVPAGAWQAAAPRAGTHGYTLVGCTVAPGFDFAGFELAPPDWSPGRPVC